MITRRTFIRSSALVASTLVLGGATGGLAGCAGGADVLRVGTKIDVPGFGFQKWTSRASWRSASRAAPTRCG